MVRTGDGGAAAQPDGSAQGPVIYSDWPHVDGELLAKEGSLGVRPQMFDHMKEKKEKRGRINRSPEWILIVLRTSCNAVNCHQKTATYALTQLGNRVPAPHLARRSCGCGTFEAF